MKKILTKTGASTMVAGLILALVATGVFGQTSLPGSGWWTKFAIQNISSTSASISVTAYDAGSVATYGTPLSTVWPNWALSIDPSSFSSMSGTFSGSGLVTSDQPAAAVTTLQNLPIGSYGTTGGTAIALYQGINTPQKVFYFPLVKNNYYGFSTIYYVQNAGSTATTFTADFVMLQNLTYHYTVTTALVQPNQMIAIVPGDAGVPSTGSGTQANFGYGSITANDSAGLISSAWFEYPVGQNPMTVVRGTSGFTDSDAGATGYVGIVKNNYNCERSSIQFINRESFPITVSLEYRGINYMSGYTNCIGQIYTDTLAIGANSFNSQGQFEPFTTFPLGCYGSAVLKGTGRFIALGNEGYPTGCPAIQSCAKAGMRENGALKLEAPLFQDDRLITVGGTQRNFRNGFQVQNTADASASVVANFYCYGGASGTTPFTATTEVSTLTPQTGMMYRRPYEDQGFYFDGAGGVPFTMSNALCSVVVTSTQPLIGWVSQSEDNAAADKGMYEAFTLP